MTKFCADCKWCHIPHFLDRLFKDYKTAVCARPALLDPVSGDAIVYCWSERNAVSTRLDPCGVDGVHYEEKGL